MKLIELNAKAALIAKSFSKLRACPGVGRSGARSSSYRAGWRHCLPAYLSVTCRLAVFAGLAFSAFIPASASAEELTCANARRSEFEALNAVKRTLTSVLLRGEVTGLYCGETKWSVGWSIGPSGPWTAFPAGSGILLGVEEGHADVETGELTGLEPETTYYALGSLENKAKPETLHHTGHDDRAHPHIK